MKKREARASRFFVAFLGALLQKRGKRDVSFPHDGNEGVLLRDQKYQKSKRGTLSSFEHLLSPRGDSCEHTAPTVQPQTKPEARFKPPLKHGLLSVQI